MPHIAMPMNTAHQHAANAEDHLGSGLLIPAVDEHLKAAEAYMAAFECSNDESAKRTLKMLSNEHRKAAQELERKIARLREEGKDPSLPQKVDHPKSPSRTSQISPSLPPSPRMGGMTHRPLADSGNVDESFMVLNGQRSDPGDAFNQFWNIMQGMLDNLSQPVAFATVPLGNPETRSSRSSPSVKSLHREGSLSSDTDPDEPMVSKISRRLGISRRQSPAPVSPLQSTVSPQETEEEFDEFLEDGDNLLESFYVISSGAESSEKALKKENAALKLEVEATKKRLEATDKILQLRKEQDLQLRDSIYMATKEAQRMTTSVNPRSPMPDIGILNINNNPMPPLPVTGYYNTREIQYARRVKELEEELKIVKVEVDKLRADNIRLRERWAKVKESARRKKEMKIVADIAKTAVRERIVEEPEAEAVEDFGNSSPSVAI